MPSGRGAHDNRCEATQCGCGRLHAAGDHLDTGFLSIPFLLDVLEESGHTDVAWSLLLQYTAPSWLYEVEEGATTTWESWFAVDSQGNVGAMSFNHYAFGAVDGWLYRRVAGLAPVELSAGQHSYSATL